MRVLEGRGWRGRIELRLRLGLKEVCVSMSGVSYMQEASRNFWRDDSDTPTNLRIEISGRIETSAGSSSGMHLSFESLLCMSSGFLH